MEYRIKSSGDLKTRSELKSANKNTSFPNVWNESVLDFLNVDPVLDSPKPKAGKYEIVERDGVVQDSNNNWVQAWKVSDMFSDVTDDDGTFHSKADQEKAHQAEIDARTASTNRQIRNQLLAETDWTASSDVTMSDAMKAYRQALRDVPAQSGFPTDITWPKLGE
jgi:hypothetical protein